MASRTDDMPKAVEEDGVPLHLDLPHGHHSSGNGLVALGATGSRGARGDLVGAGQFPQLAMR